VFHREDKEKTLRTLRLCVKRYHSVSQRRPVKNFASLREKKYHSVTQRKHREKLCLKITNNHE